MTKYELKLKIKEEQKEVATKIKELKYYRKLDKFNSNKDYLIKKYDLKDYYGGYNNHVALQAVAWGEDYRVVHIAYCMFFNNTPYEKIESNAKYTYPSKHYILDRAYDYIKKWKEIIKEGEEQ